MALAELRIELVWSPAAGDVRQTVLTVLPGTRLGQVLLSQQVDVGDRKVGIWGRIRALDTLLHDGDRIEVYRPLTIDPMAARRRRYAARGERIVSRHRPLAGKASR
jgi:putative ubiquitin-RnfH superfamily antitoxin RatB of RatAB toxin-antitoxin module